jgi:site-specific DNA-cytosine methylase
MTSKRVYKVFCPFGGMGAGAFGFSQAQVRLLGCEASFEVMGGIDFDQNACQDFELLTGVPEWHADVEKIAAADLRARHPVGPDVVFMSPPCKGSSKLLSNAKAQEPKYQRMNKLAIVWTALMLEAWGDNLPRLILFENVPHIVTRAKATVEGVRRLLRAAGYVTHDGFHDCGEIGGLAQYRKRFLMVARLPKRVPSLLYQPPKKRVRGCGEVLGELPMPEDPSAGPMHFMPKISWLNWIRLALIPAGGDWRDLPGVLADGQPRREKFRRNLQLDWAKPSATIGGSGSNGPTSIADPRVEAAAARRAQGKAGYYPGVLGVTDWDEPAGTIASESSPTNGRFSVADPRARFGNCDRVNRWEDPSQTVTSSPAPSSGAGAVADPRLDVRFGSDNPNRHWNKYAVIRWGDPAKTITSKAQPGSGGLSVADIRVKRAYDNGYGVLRWRDASPTVAAGSAAGQGAYSVADPRLGCTPRSGAYGVVGWDEASPTIGAHHKVDNSAAAIADARIEEPEGGAWEPVDIGDPKKAPAETPLIIADDGTWHRPLTTLELAALQGLPTKINGSPLVLAGSGSTDWREAIGNAVPPPAAKAIAEKMLVTLVGSEIGALALSGGGAVWVETNDSIEPGWMQVGHA